MRFRSNSLALATMLTFAAGATAALADAPVGKTTLTATAPTGARGDASNRLNVVVWYPAPDGTVMRSRRRRAAERPTLRGGRSRRRRPARVRARDAAAPRALARDRRLRDADGVARHAARCKRLCRGGRRSPGQQLRVRLYDARLRALVAARERPLARDRCRARRRALRCDGSIAAASRRRASRSAARRSSSPPAAASTCSGY